MIVKRRTLVLQSCVFHLFSFIILSLSCIAKYSSYPVQAKFAKNAHVLQRDVNHRAMIFHNTGEYQQCFEG